MTSFEDVVTAANLNAMWGNILSQVRQKRIVFFLSLISLHSSNKSTFLLFQEIEQMSFYNVMYLT